MVIEIGDTVLFSQKHAVSDPEITGPSLWSDDLQNLRKCDRFIKDGNLIKKYPTTRH